MLVRTCRDKDDVVQTGNHGGNDSEKNSQHPCHTAHARLSQYPRPTAKSVKHKKRHMLSC